jgi:hypothetical protein
MLAVCGSTHRDSYRDIVMVGIIGALVALAAVIALGSVVGSFSAIRVGLRRGIRAIQSKDIRFCVPDIRQFARHGNKARDRNGLGASRRIDIGRGQ